MVTRNPRLRTYCAQVIEKTPSSTSATTCNVQLEELRVTEYRDSGPILAIHSVKQRDFGK